jgi:adenylyltransferase/sulfurtransferase
MNAFIKHITAPELKEMIDKGEKLQLIDAREKEDFEIYHIDGAIWIHRNELLEKADLLSRDIPVIIYCKYGMKSPPVIKTLSMEKNFTNLYSLREGLYDWMKLYDRNALDLL